ncbi:hypothetical protein Fmac_002678 [Flemingia macrophylla]|uniref:RING-type E3 ubiquitin transferase n=1 Tax=Flemingia macrophylla TaxID=520843 RepID=A0ABD1NMB9_9FABA
MAYAERREARYSYRVLSSLELHQTLMHEDVFRFTVRVYLNTTPPTLLLHAPSRTISCRSFFQDVRFLKTLLSRIHFFIESPEEITESVVSDVRGLFQVEGFGSSSPSSSSEFQRRVIPLSLEVTLVDNGLLAAMEESVQGMIPASDEVIQMSLKKSTAVTWGGGCCPICKEEPHVDDECYTMPCHHAFHHQCIVSWLRVNHVCPLCRYPLPILKT